MIRLIRGSIARSAGTHGLARVCRLAATFVVLMATIIPQTSVLAQETPAESRPDGWFLLWENQFEEAIQAFGSVLESNDEDL